MKIGQIRMDGGTQPRADINDAVVHEYAEAMTAGAIFPPVVVFHDGTDHWLADGFHRVRAALYLGNATIDADVRQGTRRDAILHSVGANSEHGLRRTNDDKRRAVELLLADPEWSRWSDRRIAIQCGVSDFMVRGMRASVSARESQIAPTTRTVERNGTTYQQDTTNIGRARISASAPAGPASAEPAPAPSVPRLRSIPVNLEHPKRSADDLIAKCDRDEVVDFAMALLRGLYLRGWVKTMSQLTEEMNAAT